MQKADIRSKCRINSNREADTFVGLKSDDGDISIHFPLGYHISEKDDGLRKDILLLFATLAANTKRKDSEISGNGIKFEEVDFPLQAYMFLVRDYLSRGYYREQEKVCHCSKTGKIDWNKTIKTQKTYIQNQQVFYLDFITKKNAVRENAMITLIHEYCVYESFDKIGWLFTKSMPKKPRIKKEDKVFKTVIQDKLSKTFQDCNRQLFRNMLAIINYEGDRESEKNYKYGTYRFEYVWEQMIDKVFGIGNKADYFPKTMWRLGDVRHDNASLEPDTIMIYQNNVYVLDAKYYKYGISGNLQDLPGSASINKQITYGEYIAKQDSFRKLHGEQMKVYNAFLIPFDSQKTGNLPGLDMQNIGEALSNWKDNTKEYHKIKGILIDVKKLMGIHVRQAQDEIRSLAELME